MRDGCFKLSARTIKPASPEAAHLIAIRFAGRLRHLFLAEHATSRNAFRRKAAMRRAGRQSVKHVPAFRDFPECLGWVSVRNL
jgi:hypothetical protein